MYLWCWGKTKAIGILLWTALMYLEDMLVKVCGPANHILTINHNDKHCRESALFKLVFKCF